MELDLQYPQVTPSTVFLKKTSVWSKGNILNNMQTIKQARRVECFCKWKHEMVLLSAVSCTTWESQNGPPRSQTAWV